MNNIVEWTKDENGNDNGNENKTRNDIQIVFTGLDLVDADLHITFTNQTRKPIDDLKRALRLKHEKENEREIRLTHTK